jgi:predicted nuclease of predicted toxin-antitoxin system
VHLYPDSNHVTKLGLDRASDLVVWQHKHKDGYCLVTKDADFNDLLAAKGFPPKVIWIRLGNCTTAEIATPLKNHHQTIADFIQDNSAGLLELQ